MSLFGHTRLKATDMVYIGGIVYGRGRTRASFPGRLQELFNLVVDQSLYGSVWCEKDLDMHEHLMAGLKRSSV